jgi:hypothetical protein
MSKKETQGFNLILKFRDKDNNVKELIEYHSNEQGAYAAMGSYAFRYGPENILGYSVNPRKNHLELKKEYALPQRENAYAKIK